MTEVIAENQKLKVELLQLKVGLKSVISILQKSIEEEKDKLNKCEEYSYEYYLHKELLKNNSDLLDKILKATGENKYEN